MAPQQAPRVVRPSPDLTTLSSVTDDTIVTRLRERVSVDAPWSRVSNSLLIYVNRFNGEADQFPAPNDPEGEPGLDEVCSRIGRWMHLEGSNEQSIILLYALLFCDISELISIVERLVQERASREQTFFAL